MAQTVADQQRVTGRFPHSLPRRGVAGRAARFIRRHPVLVVASVALAARLGAIALLRLGVDGPAVPDEAQYLGLAAAVARGAGADAWQPGYGQSLYDVTATFMRPLSALVYFFGPHRIVGQLMVVVLGVAAAVVTVGLAQRVLPTRFALGAGLLVALLPSQVFWSSVVLRESFVWLALLVVAIGITLTVTASSRRTALLGLLVALVAGTALGDLRQQTALVAVWSVVPTMLVAATRYRVLAVTGSLVVALAAPLFAGMGPGGLTLAQQALPALATIRGSLSLGADSSFIERDSAIPPGSSAPSSGVRAPTEPEVSPAPGTVVLTAPSGERFVVDEGADATVSALPRGLVAVALRPWPWEAVNSKGAFMAKLETPLWVALYVLAAIGACVGWSRRSVLAYPAIVTVGILAMAAITQGNLGTAFRHRGQILWALALLAAAGVNYLVIRRQERHRPLSEGRLAAADLLQS